MQPSDLLLSTFAGAMIVISGGLYALLLAFAKLRRSRRLTHAAAGAYVVLAVFVFVLSDRLAFDRAWNFVVAVMLLGYFAAPHAIWHLTHATHAEPIDEN